MDRIEFRNKCLERDHNQCVVCGTHADCVHHIVERRLFSENDPIPSGYHIDNGASVCANHHFEAESTMLSAQALRDYIGITRVILPEHLDPDEQYDKWANILMNNGMRAPGELFYDESVQKVLEPVLHLFTPYLKYPKTFHLPFSRMATHDDRTLNSVAHFEGKDVVVMHKLDGEHTVMYNDFMHARSLSYPNHPSRGRMKALHAQIKHDIPVGIHVHGENMFGKHTIYYQNLEHFFYVHSVWDKNICLSWDETVEWAELLDLPICPVLYRGIWDEKLIRGLYQDMYDNDPMEGYVVRLSTSFPLSKFRWSVAKYVEHPIDNSNHWYHSQFVPNKLKE